MIHTSLLRHSGECEISNLRGYLLGSGESGLARGVLASLYGVLNRVSSQSQGGHTAIQWASPKTGKKHTRHAYYYYIIKGYQKTTPICEGALITLLCGSMIILSNRVVGVLG